MPIELTEDVERLVYKYDSSKIYYKRISKTRNNFIQKKHTKRGQVDWNAVTDEVMNECILGWDEIIDKGKIVPFSPELISRLPFVVHNDMIDLILGEGAYQGEDSPEKNSGTSLSGK